MIHFEAGENYMLELNIVRVSLQISKLKNLLSFILNDFIFSKFSFLIILDFDL